jgi:hypothetical protein
LARLQEIGKDEKLKVGFEQRRIHLEETKMSAVIIAEENWLMMLEPNEMYTTSREWWHIRRVISCYKERLGLGWEVVTTTVAVIVLRLAVVVVVVTATFVVMLWCCLIYGAFDSYFHESLILASSSPCF